VSAGIPPPCSEGLCICHVVVWMQLFDEFLRLYSRPITGSRKVKFQCRICSRTLKSYSGLVEHMWDRHSDKFDAWVDARMRGPRKPAPPKPKASSSKPAAPEPATAPPPKTAAAPSVDIPRLYASNDAVYVLTGNNRTIAIEQVAAGTSSSNQAKWKYGCEWCCCVCQFSHDWACCVFAGS
jgi:hypothetical protein